MCVYASPHTNSCRYISPVVTRHACTSVHTSQIFMRCYVHVCPCSSCLFMIQIPVFCLDIHRVCSKDVAYVCVLCVHEPLHAHGHLMNIHKVLHACAHTDFTHPRGSACMGRTQHARNYLLVNSHPLFSTSVLLPLSEVLQPPENLRRNVSQKNTDMTET